MILSIENLESGYESVQIVKGVDLDVEEGEVVSIIGPNGSGKSTLLKSVLGLVPWREGSIQYRGEEIVDEPAESMIYRGICFVPQRNDVFRSLSVEENLEMGGWHVEDQEMESRLSTVFETFPILEQRLNQRAGLLSGGQQRMLSLACALIAEPQLLILDEPSAGLAPDLVEGIFDRIASINATGTTIIMAEQNARRALTESDRGVVLVMGEKRLDESAQKVMNSEKLQELYLGSG